MCCNYKKVVHGIPTRAKALEEHEEAALIAELEGRWDVEGANRYCRFTRAEVRDGVLFWVGGHDLVKHGRMWSTPVSEAPFKRTFKGRCHRLDGVTFVDYVGGALSKETSNSWILDEGYRLSWDRESLRIRLSRHASG